MIHLRHQMSRPPRQIHHRHRVTVTPGRGHLPPRLPRLLRAGAVAGSANVGDHLRHQDLHPRKESLGVGNGGESQKPGDDHEARVLPVQEKSEGNMIAS